MIAKRDNSVGKGAGDSYGGGGGDDSTNGYGANVIHNRLISSNSANGARHHHSKPTRSDYYDSYQNGQQPAVTGTPKPPTTELDDLLISVKTTKGYHDTRLEMITKTWYQLAKEQVGFFFSLLLIRFRSVRVALGSAAIVMLR